MEDNFTLIPNYVFDYWQSKLNPSCFCVYIALYKKNYGLNENSVSLEQLMKLTGLTKNTILSSLKTLIFNNLVKKIQNKNENIWLPNIYKLNRDSIFENCDAS